jgi:hypothetical protein
MATHDNHRLADGQDGRGQPKWPSDPVRMWPAATGQFRPRVDI